MKETKDTISKRDGKKESQKQGGKVSSKATTKNNLLDPENPHMRLIDDIPKATRMVELVRANIVSKEQRATNSNIEINTIEHSLLNSLKYYLEKYGSDPKSFQERITRTDAYKMVNNPL